MGILRGQRSIGEARGSPFVRTTLVARWQGSSGGLPGKQQCGSVGAKKVDLGQGGHARSGCHTDPAALQ